MSASHVASSATSGFFQTLPEIKPQYTSKHLTKRTDAPTDDPVLDRLLKQYIPADSQPRVCSDMHQVSRMVLQPSVLAHAVEAETVLPHLSPLTTFGEENRDSPLITCHGWKALKAIGVELGAVATAYDLSLSRHNRRVHQFMVNHNWSHTACMTMCPMTMTDGSASLLLARLNDLDGDQPGRQRVLREYRRRLVSRDSKESWTSGQWMTERSGGSDVRGTETIARRVPLTESGAVGEDVLGLPLGPWVIDGFKWFSSATDSDMTMLLAQTSKGLSAFCVPLRRKAGSSTELNGIRIQRLKNKLGTKALPTAELEIKGARGWLVGEEGKGVKEISTLLNITRLHAGCGSTSSWSRALAISRAYTKARDVRGARLYHHPQLNFWMASVTVKYWAATQLGFLGVALLGCAEQGVSIMAGTPAAALFPDDKTARLLLRLLTPVIKSQVSVGSTIAIRECMESIGGVGYCENYEDGGILNVAKLFRDTTVNTIWEGTTSIMADDIGRVLKDKRLANGKIVEDVYAPWVRKVLEPCRPNFARECSVVLERLDALLSLLARVKGNDRHLEYNGRHVLVHLEIITTAVALLHDANTDHDEISSAVATRYVSSNAIPATRHHFEAADWEKEQDMDRRIFLGADFTPSPALNGKL
jgi:alkylation response protein AidB-like acyl-CoA dehydrogenase